MSFVLPQAAGASLGDIMVVAIGSLTMLSAIVLFIYGYWVSHDISLIKERILVCETLVANDTKDYRSLRALSAVLARLLAELYVVADISRRMIEDIDKGDPATKERRRDVYARHAESSLGRLSRISLYVALLDGSDGGSFYEKLEALTKKYPDRDTISFLESIQSLLTGTEREVLQDMLPGLSVQVLGVDYTRWTGTRVT